MHYNISNNLIDIAGQSAISGGGGAGGSNSYTTNGIINSPYTYTYTYPLDGIIVNYPQKYSEISIRFTENGLLLDYNGKEYVFKDLKQAAEYITKLREQK